MKFKTDSEHLEHDGPRAKNNIWLFKELPFCSRRGNMAPVGPVQHRRGQERTARDVLVKYRTEQIITGQYRTVKDSRGQYNAIKDRTGY